VRLDLKEEHDTLMTANKETLQAMNDLDTLVKNLDASQKDVVANVNQTLTGVQSTVASVTPVMVQTQKDLADLEPVIAQTQALMVQATDTTTNISKTTADIATEIHKYVYPPPQKWYQKIWGPIKLGIHMLTVPI
jgi:50S ribosomal subunit-associated GTPase HflX